MNKFLEVLDLPTLNKEDINHFNRLVTRNNIEAVIMSLQTKKSPGLDGFTAKF
jgi:hypothetical protein